jgi:hypothetical protein
MAMLIGQARDPEHVVAPIAKSSHGLGLDDCDILIRQIQDTESIEALLHHVAIAPITPGIAATPL